MTPDNRGHGAYREVCQSGRLTLLRNERSQRAIERLGAVKEGILRNHMITPDGTIRDSVYYSILDREWPAVKARLEGWLQGASHV